MDNNIKDAIDSNEFDSTEQEIICMYWELFLAGFITADRRDEAINEQVHNYQDRIDEDYDELEAALEALNDSIIY